MCDLVPSISVLGPGDAGDVRTFIRQHTSLQADMVEPLGAGMGSVAWRVDGEWVARFPLTVDAAAGLETEVSLLPLLEDALPVPVPRFEHVVHRPGGGVMMTAHQLLEGVPLSLAALAALPDSARARVLDELAGAIDALRRFPSDRARAAGVQVRPHEGFGHPTQRELHRRHAAELGDEAVARVEALWRGYETGPHHQHTVPDALAHADLKPEHVLHDPTSG
jgi:aminoglycoside phosphotransferase (APT) family kinase protein